MTTYGSNEDYLKDQISSFVKAKKILKEYKNKIDTELLLDYRGDKDKVIEGLEKGLKHLNKEKKKLELELKNLVPSNKF